MIAFMFAVACLALGLVHAAHLVAPPRADHAKLIERWYDDRARATRQRESAEQVPSSPTQRIVARLADEVERRGRDLDSWHQDLAIVGTTMERHLSKLLSLAVVALVAPPVILGVLSALGLSLPWSVGLMLGVGLSAAMSAIVHRELRGQAATRRAEFRRSLSIYLDLVSMALDAGRGHAEALPAAAKIGTGWTFEHLQDAIDGARFSGVTAWESLGILGHRIGLPELVDLDAALRLANEDGAKVKATFIARAGTLRAARIADAESEANEATESMKFTLIVMVFAFLGYELYPSIVRLFSG